MPKLSPPESYELARMSMDMVSDMVLWLDSSSRFFLVNQAACDLLGYSHEELLAMSVNDIDMGHPREAWEEHWQDISKEKSQLVISSYRKRNGSTIPVEIHAHIINFNDNKYVCSTVRDITDRKNFELALSEKEEKYQKTFHKVPSAVYLSSLPEGRLIEVNKTFETISGFSREELIGKTVEELNFYINPEDRVALLGKLQKEGKLEDYEIYYQIRSGEPRLCIVNAEPILIDGKQYLVGAITDVTDQKKAERELKESEEKYRLLIENIPDVVWSTDGYGNTNFISANVTKVYGYEPDEILSAGSKLWFDRIHPEDKSLVKLSFDALLKGDKPFDLEYRIKRMDGEWIWIHDRALITYEDEGLLYAYGVFSDITNRKISEKELLVYQENLRSMAAELATVEDREKRTIAEYLHDHLGQSLALAKIKIGRTLRNEQTPEIIDALNDIEKDITDAINYSQSVIYELSPPILYELGLIEALKWKMHDFEKKEGISTGLNVPEKISSLEQDTSIILFRSATELLNNVVKHSGASYVRLVIQEKKSVLVMSIADNGFGFDYEQSQADHSKDHKFGLFSIKERLKYYGGTIEIQSPKEGGSVISLFVPLK